MTVIVLSGNPHISRKIKHEDYEFKACLGYMVRSYLKPHRTNETAQQITALGIKPENLSPVTRIQMVEEENRVLKAVLWLWTHLCHGTLRLCSPHPHNKEINLVI